MTKHNLFSNVPATNGAARGYGPRSHKPKREMLRLATLSLLVSVTSLTLIDEANAGQRVIDGYDAQAVIANGHVQHFETDSNGYGYHNIYLIHYVDNVYWCKWSWLSAVEPQTVETFCVTYSDD